jgi:hypothetical protein
MSREDVKERLTLADEQKLNEILENLELKDLVVLYRDSKKMIVLAKATYEGLRKAVPSEKLKWYPEWLSKDFVF